MKNLFNVQQIISVSQLRRVSPIGKFYKFQSIVRDFILNEVLGSALLLCLFAIKALCQVYIILSKLYRKLFHLDG